MRNAIVDLNYLAVAIAAVAGFVLGWLWYSPLLFARAWMREIKFTEEMMKAAAARGLAKLFLTGFAYTFVSSFGLAVLIRTHFASNWMNGAMLGAFVGATIVATRLWNSSLWEQRSLKFMVIVGGHEVVLFTLQGAILGSLFYWWY